MTDSFDRWEVCTLPAIICKGDHAMKQADCRFSRRKFLNKAGAAAATGFTIVRPESVRGSQANSKIAVGLTGVCGRGSFDGGVCHTDRRAPVTALCAHFDDRIETCMQ